MADANTTTAPVSGNTSAPAPVDAAPAASSGTSGSGTPAAASAPPPNTDGAPKPAVASTPPKLPDANVEPLPKFPVPDEVDWDKWDGKPDLLPEQIRPWYERFDGRYKKELSARDKQIQHFKTLYDALSFGEDDPRIGELTGKVSTYEQKIAEYEARIAEFERAEEERIDTEARAAVDRFWQENQDIKNDPELLKGLGALVEAGWYFGHAGKLLRMPEQVREWATEQLKAGVPAEKVVEYAEERAKRFTPATPPKRPAANLVAGNGPVAQPAVADKNELEDFTNLDEWRAARVAKILKKQAVNR